MKRYAIFLMTIGLLILSACTGPTTTTEPNEIPTSPQDSPSQTPPTTSVVKEAEESTSTPAPTTKPPQQTSELDMVKDVLRLNYVIDGYKVECILPSAFGLPGQLALLPNGDIVINDKTFRRLLLLSDNKLSTLVVRDDLWSAVAALPDGRICYSLKNGQLLLLDYIKGINEILGSTPRGDTSLALAADKDGNIYAATIKNNLYRFNADGDTITIATNLPFKKINQITDMDIASDGTIYIVGINRFIDIRPSGEVTIIADDLQNEPSRCEIAPNDDVYIKEVSDIRLLDPTTGELTPVQIDFNAGVSDLIAISNDEFLFFYMGSNIIYRYNLKTREAAPVIVNTINDHAFAVGAKDIAFLATPNLSNPKLGSILKSHIVSLKADGTREDLADLTFARIVAADVDKENRLCLYADESFHCIETDGSVTSVTPEFSLGEQIKGTTNFAVGPDGLFYCITRAQDTIKIWCVDGTGVVNVLPITFNRNSFGDVYTLGDVGIDVDDKGHLVFIVTAKGTKGRGPFYQEVYKADADGTNMTQIATFDSERTGGFVDISVDTRGDVFVLTLGFDEPGPEVIYRISADNEVSKVIEIHPGRDPKSIDVDSEGNVWFCTTVGVFRATRSR